MTIAHTNWFRVIRVCALIGIGCVLSGCVPLGMVGMATVAPVPRLSKKKIEYGREITAREVQFVAPGRTTRTELITRLGNDFRDSPRVAALAYSWQYNGLQIYWNYGFVFAGEAGHGVEDYGWRAWFVALDENDKVVQTQFYRLRGRKSLDEQLEDWAQRNGAASTTGKNSYVSK